MNRKWKFVDWVVLLIVVLNALIVITLSFGNTAKLAATLSLNPYLTAGLVELMFGTLLFLRGKQRSLSLNVPILLSAGYFASFAFVTGVNMWGLSKEHSVIGPIVGLVISAAMWLMENILVWLATEAAKPYQKTWWDLIKERWRRRQQVNQMIKDEKECQRLEWMKWEAQKPDLSLIKKARKAEREREEVLKDGLPEFFQSKEFGERNKTETIVIEPKAAEIVPISKTKKPIGFHAIKEEYESNSGKEKTDPGEHPGEQYIEQAISKAREMVQQGKQIGKDLGRNTLAKAAGVTPHYAKLALQRLKQEEQEID